MQLITPRDELDDVHVKLNNELNKRKMFDNIMHYLTMSPLVFDYKLMHKTYTILKDKHNIDIKQFNANFYDKLQNVKQSQPFEYDNTAKAKQ